MFCRRVTTLRIGFACKSELEAEAPWKPAAARRAAAERVDGAMMMTVISDEKGT